MDNKIKHKKRIRLKDFPYKGEYRYFITISTFDKQAYFQESSKVDLCSEFLNNLSVNYNFKIWGYCFMPDHLHMLIEGITKSSDMIKFVSMYKQKTAYSFKTEYNSKLWQHNYYEHILRDQEATKSVLRYIIENPVRKGLVNHYSEYPHTGSFEVDLNDL